jgi:hypothetical protein
LTSGCKVATLTICSAESVWLPLHMETTIQPVQPKTPYSTKKARHNVICAARQFVDGPYSKSDENFFKLVAYLDTLDRLDLPVRAVDSIREEDA